MLSTLNVSVKQHTPTNQKSAALSNGGRDAGRGVDHSHSGLEQVIRHELRAQEQRESQHSE